MTRKGEPVEGPVVMKEEGQPPAPEIVIGGVRLVAHVSGDRLALRVRDPNGPLARDFRGFTWFPIDPKYRVVGKFVPDADTKKVTVQNTFGDMDTYMTEGVVEFEQVAAAEGVELAGDLFEDVENAGEVALGRLEFRFREALFGLEARDARGFLDQLAAVGDRLALGLWRSGHGGLRGTRRAGRRRGSWDLEQGTPLVKPAGGR